jgi:hypothetical protein
MSKMHNTVVVSALVTLVSGAGCINEAEDGIEDTTDDTFLSADEKADAFGAEDFSPDGLAVLRFATNASATALRNDVGLSQRIVDGIIAFRKGPDNRANTADDKHFGDLAELDAVPFFGKRAFDAMLITATVKNLYKTSLRVPLLDESGKPLANNNRKMKAVGLREFGKFRHQRWASVAGWDVK